MPEFKDNLKALRKREHLTQEELANKLGIKRSRLNGYERGVREPDFETLELICDFFNVDMDTIVGRSNIPEDSPVTQYDLDNMSDGMMVLLQTLKGASEDEILQAVKIIEALKKQ